MDLKKRKIRMGEKKDSDTHILGLFGVADNRGLFGAVVSGVSDNAAPTPPLVVACPL